MRSESIPDECPKIHLSFANGTFGSFCLKESATRVMVTIPRGKLGGIVHAAGFTPGVLTIQGKGLKVSHYALRMKCAA